MPEIQHLPAPFGSRVSSQPQGAQCTPHPVSVRRLHHSVAHRVAQLRPTLRLALRHTLRYTLHPRPRVMLRSTLRPSHAT